MTTVTAGGTSTFNLGPFDKVVVTAGNSAGVFAFTSAAPKTRGNFNLAAVNGTFGPYNIYSTVVLTVTSGSVTFYVDKNRALDADYTLAATDDQAILNPSTALTITIPASLSPRPLVVVVPPPSGNVSVAVSGGATANAATTTLTRARSANPAGFAITPYMEGDGYGVGGS